MRNIKMTMSRMQLNSKTSSNPKNQATIQDGRVVIQNVQGRQNRGHGNNTRGAGAASYRGGQNRVGYANPGQARQIKCYNCNGIGHLARICTQPKRPQNSEYFKDKMLLMQARENGVAFNVPNVPDEAGPSYDSDILTEVHAHDHYQDAVCEHHKVHEIHDDVQLNYVADSHTHYTSDSNMISYDQDVKDNVVPVVQSNVSFVPNNAYMMILNDMHEQPDQHISVTAQTNVVDKSLTAELATYKEQFELYKRRARFKLTKRE
nr:hypothetical protein [Tanacetum cinerariifolium]